MNRVVVTGCGVVSPLGNDVASLLDALVAGRSGVVRMDAWTAYRGLRSHVAAPVPAFDERVIERRFRRTMGRLALFGTLAADQAVRDAGLAAGGDELREGG